MDAGDFTVRVYNRTADCFTDVAVVLQEPMPTASISDILKCTTNSETIEVNPSGGMIPYSYSWSGPFIGMPATNQSFNTSIPGIYTVTVTDFKGCTTTASGELTFQSKVCLPATFTIKRN